MSDKEKISEMKNRNNPKHRIAKTVFRLAELAKTIEHENKPIPFLKGMARSFALLENLVNLRKGVPRKNPIPYAKGGVVSKHEHTKEGFVNETRIIGFKSNHPNESR